MLLRFDPFRELDEARSDLWGSRAPAMPFDAVRRGDEVVATFDLPGVDPESIDLTVERDVLTVRAERTAERHEGDDVVVSERRYGSFSRQLFLGDTLDGEAVHAHYDRGVLTVTIPVKAQAKPRKITVGKGKAEAIETSAAA